MKYTERKNFHTERKNFLSKIFLQFIRGTVRMINRKGYHVQFPPVLFPPFALRMSACILLRFHTRMCLHEGNIIRR